MAVIKIIPLKDTTVNSFIDTNKGIDEILGLGVQYITKSVNRILITFDTNYINNLDTIYSGSVTKYLNMYVATANTLPSNYTIECYQLLDGNWNNGIGNSTYNDTNGISWSSYISSYDTTKIKLLEKSYSIYDDKDINLNVTNSTNYSYAINIKNDINLATGSTFNLNYFSRDTNTIYSPTIDYKFTDSVYTVPVSGSVVTKNSIVISLKNNSNQFYVDSNYRINIGVRDMYPDRLFLKTSLFSQKKYLPATSYYCVRDIEAKYNLIEFDTIYTTVSLDTNGNFFNLYTKNFETNRYYSIDLKVIINGSEQIYKDLYHFKIFDK